MTDETMTPNGGDLILTIHGTVTPEEWLDDLTSMVPAPWTGTGLVGFGFNRIYQTLRVVPFEASAATAMETFGADLPLARTGRESRSPGAAPIR